MNAPAESLGGLLRTWRQRRRWSQLELACEAEISQRHLSFLESGRSQPSRDMIERLSESLDIPLRERNVLFLAAGFAPLHVEHDWQAPALDAARRVVERVLEAHVPFPALAVDRHWTLQMANRALGVLLDGVDAALLQPPVNALRVSLHPQGLAPHIVNFHEWRAHVLARLKQQIERSVDAVLRDLLAELESYPVPAEATLPDDLQVAEFAGIAVPLLLRVNGQVLSFLSTTTLFGTPTDISLSELAIETFFPADEATTAALRAACA